MEARSKRTAASGKTLIALAIDTSADFASVAVSKDGKLLETAVLKKKRSGEGLLEEIERIRKHHFIENFDSVAVATGPGSYTGIRVGLALAQGLARSTGAKFIVVSSLLAKLFLEEVKAGEIEVTLPARTGEEFFCKYLVTDCMNIKGINSISSRLSNANTNTTPLAEGVLKAAHTIKVYDGSDSQFEKISPSDPVLPLYGKDVQARTLVERGLV